MKVRHSDAHHKRVVLLRGLPWSSKLRSSSQLAQKVLHSSGFCRSRQVSAISCRLQSSTYAYHAPFARGGGGGGAVRLCLEQFLESRHHNRMLCSSIIAYHDKRRGACLACLSAAAGIVRRLLGPPGYYTSSPRFACIVVLRRPPPPAHTNPNDPAPSLIAMRSLPASISLLLYSGRSSWFMHVCALHSRPSSPPAHLWIWNFCRAPPLPWSALKPSRGTCSGRMVSGGPHDTHTRFSQRPPGSRSLQLTWELRPFKTSQTPLGSATSSVNRHNAPWQSPLRT